MSCQYPASQVSLSPGVSTADKNQLFCTLSLVLPSLTPSPQPKELLLMSSTGQATSSSDNIKLVNGALADYAKETGIDLSTNPFAAKFEQSLARSPNALLQLLEEREKAFKEYRDGKRRLINCLNPAVTILHRFSGIFSGAVGLVSAYII